MSENMAVISQFNIFSEFDQQLVNKIKLFYLTKSELLFVSTDNSIFHSNIRDHKFIEFKKCFENEFIIKFDCSNDLSPHCMALTDNGYVYSWGNNSEGQLGQGNNKECEAPKLIDHLKEEFITDICCGAKHSIVLTRNGQVFAFGSNSCAQCCLPAFRKQTCIPVKIQIPCVITISSGDWHSIALTQTGAWFGWGENRFGQLGIEGIEYQQIPQQISVPPIQQIMCGNYYTLLLSSDNDIYFCGLIDKCLPLNRPTKINTSQKCIKIGASIHSKLCVALSLDNKCYIFGESYLSELNPTDFSSIDDTFAFYEQITYKSLKTNASNYKLNFVEMNALGMGAFSTVFKSQCKFDRKVYAIKKVCFDSEKRQNVIKELNILSQLDCNFVVKYVDSWIEQNYYIGSYDRENAQNISADNLLYSPNLPYLLHIQMELCALTLRDAINAITNKCLTDSYKTLSLIGYFISYELFVELLICVQYLHQQNIIHRDLKPENILITHFGNNRFVKLSDFGLSTFHSFADQSHTKYRGTKNYRAIEVNQTSKYTTKADIYSLGIILQELFHFDNSDIWRTYIRPIEQKMRCITDLSEKLLSPSAAKRPTSDVVLSELYSQRLSDYELKFDDQFMLVLRKPANIHTIESNFIEFFIHKKLLR